MACLLTAPHGSARGVVCFTTPERDDLIREDESLRRLVEKLKARFVVGLHHNWHDHTFRHDPLFDFSMAGKGDLIEVSGRAVPLVDMDACNFAPSCFKPGGAKFWDVLHVSRFAAFKNVPLLFRSIRALYDAGHRLRVLYICPVAAGETDGCSNAEAARVEYDRMFGDDEQDLFNFLSLDYRYPFPFDLETLAFFYRSSKVFVHCADQERRCRVAGYAWASGLPVVAQRCVGSLLPAQLQVEPYFFEASDANSFARQLTRAVASADYGGIDFARVRAMVSADVTPAVFVEKIAKTCAKSGIDIDASAAALTGLDIRLGRHHGLPAGRNALAQPLRDFIEALLSADDTEIAAVMAAADPEAAIAAHRGLVGLADLPQSNTTNLQDAPTPAEERQSKRFSFVARVLGR